MSKPFYILAPMDDVTDTVFRRVVSDCSAPEYTMTEFVNVDALCSAGRFRVIRKLDTTLDTVPVIAQVWGKYPENFETIAREISEGVISGFSGIDINFGCPAKSEVKNECCSALAQGHLRDKALAIILSLQKGAGDMPVSFKTRLGFSEIDYSWHEFLLNQKPSILTVHVRTTREMSKVPAHWEAIEPILKLRNKISPETKIVLNGDIMNKKQGNELAEKYGVDGIMIGRGVFQDPYCHALSSPWKKIEKPDRIKLFIKHLELHNETYPGETRKFNPIKKFAKIYVSDFEGASELRDKLMHTESVDGMIIVLKSEL